MDVRRRALLASVAALVAAAGCGHQDAPPAESARGTAASTTPVAGAAKPACPKDGHWSECQVFARLEASGVAPRREGSIPDLPALGVTPKTYTIGTVGLAVYLFADSTARARAARSLDTLHFIAPAAELTMRGEATAIQNDNLLALLFSRNDQQRERVSDALMAGAPRP